MEMLAGTAGLDGVGLAKLMRDRELHPLEVAESAIRCIERTHSKLNAVTAPMFDRAREAARNVRLGAPLAGVPYLLKDLRAGYAGAPTSDGSALLCKTPRAFDSEIVARHKRAGLVCVGKANTPELGLTATTEPHAFGPTRNPWNLQLTPGGSSGGSAAAVAARLVPVAHASDGGGSIRIPAACCGLVGLKPTRGRNSLAPEAGDVMNGLVVEHALTLSVRDSAAMLDATSGPVPGDPYWAPCPERPFLQEVGRDPGSLRIAFSTRSPMGTAVHASCVRAVERTAELLEDLGHEVTEGEPDYDDRAFRKAFNVLWFSNLAANLGWMGRQLGRELTERDCEPLTWKFAVRGAQCTAADYIAAVARIQRISRRVAPFFDSFDVWVTPTVASPPPSLGYLHPRPGEADLRPFPRRVREFVPFTQLANATGQPAISLPLHWSAGGLPIGVHFAGRYGAESTLVRLAAQLEEAWPWRGRRPLTHAGGAPATRAQALPDGLTRGTEPDVPLSHDAGSE